VKCPTSEFKGEDGEGPCNQAAANQRSIGTCRASSPVGDTITARQECKSVQRGMGVLEVSCELVPEVIRAALSALMISTDRSPTLASPSGVRVFSRRVSITAAAAGGTRSDQVVHKDHSTRTARYERIPNTMGGRYTGGGSNKCSVIRVPVVA